MIPLLLNKIHPSCSSVIQLLLESEVVFDVRRTLSDTIFLVLMRLMTSSWMQEEMEYPLMRTISSPTYTSAQDEKSWMTPSLLIYIKITDDFIAAPTTYIPECWTHQLQYDLLIDVTDLCWFKLHFKAYQGQGLKISIRQTALIHYSCCIASLHVT